MTLRWGSLWYDQDSSKSFEMVLMEAANFFEHKHGVRPDTCHVNVEDVRVGDALEINGIAIQKVRSVIRNHLFIGVSETEREPMERVEKLLVDN